MCGVRHRAVCHVAMVCWLTLALGQPAAAETPSSSTPSAPADGEPEQLEKVRTLLVDSRDELARNARLWVALGMAAGSLALVVTAISLTALPAVGTGGVWAHPPTWLTFGAQGALLVSATGAMLVAAVLFVWPSWLIVDLQRMFSTRQGKEARHGA